MPPSTPAFVAGQVFALLMIILPSWFAAVALCVIARDVRRWTKWHAEARDRKAAAPPDAPPATRPAAPR